MCFFYENRKHSKCSYHPFPRTKRMYLCVVGILPTIQFVPAFLILVFVININTWRVETHSSKSMVFHQIIQQWYEVFMGSSRSMHTQNCRHSILHIFRKFSCSIDTSGSKFRRIIFMSNGFWEQT